MSTPPRGGQKASINRQETTPFHLKLFYRVDNFHNLSDFTPSPSRNHGGLVSGSNAIQNSSAPLPPHLEIYTWHSCTLTELSHLLTSTLPKLLPDTPIGTRLCFRLLYPDARSAAINGPDAVSRFLSKDLGSVIVAPKESPYRDEKEADRDEGLQSRAVPLRFQGSDADKELQDARFIIGDYIECAILPPLEDGSIAPPLRGSSGPSGPPTGMRAFRDNGYGRSDRGGPRDHGGPRNRGGDRGGRDFPQGDWSRGERLPYGGRDRGGGRRGYAPY
ncbi:hypothetical protein N7495_002021 [Penicillium taxi]|uniref:uncharacterized protein n=1 Tax=Penicillium taxi TaxID=168475 RepID=UPI002545316A|nr:uncharacterized protein N7495_002021 [Penicillium taxi]KAJ5901493.1 hypothetical protein N7495_002021 [Penicillium taxi]